MGTWRISTATALAAGAAAVAALAAGAAAPPEAHAARNPYTAAGVCGPGYTEIARRKLYDHGGWNGRRYLLSELVLMYSASSGRNCAVNMKRFRVGTPDHMYVSLQTKRAGDGDGGRFAYYAGPAYVYARRQCIQWWGGARMVVRRQGARWTLEDGFRSNWSGREWQFCR